jgi:hypothetical protein
MGDILLLQTVPQDLPHASADKAEGQHLARPEAGSPSPPADRRLRRMWIHAWVAGLGRLVLIHHRDTFQCGIRGKNKGS